MSDGYTWLEMPVLRVSAVPMITASAKMTICNKNISFIILAVYLPQKGQAVILHDIIEIKQL